ncbi:DUF1648 domain-containing protein [Pseudalkalibacillus sp. R45]|uniref:DUF1648 domain-containing protein n=1 Tax=Pseudalkalibacillus sp. R45 TaxID=3457433 RepID=UPI003FCE004D
MYLVMQWSSIPNKVPVHFNFAGEPDNWGHKGLIWLLLFIGISMWIGLTFLEKYPHVYNYITLTEENIEKQYKNASMMINVIKNELLILFVLLTWRTVQVAKGSHENLPGWDLPVILGILFITLAFFINRSFRL